LRGDDGFEDRGGHQAPFTLPIADCRLPIADRILRARSALWTAAARRRFSTLKTERRVRETEVCSRLFRLLNRPNDLVKIRPLAGLEFGMEQFTIGANFEGAAARRNQRKRFNALAEFENLGRQTDGLRRVISNDAVFD
jgi:hypothetical protein